MGLVSLQRPGAVRQCLVSWAVGVRECFHLLKPSPDQPKDESERATDALHLRAFGDYATVSIKLKWLHCLGWAMVLPANVVIRSILFLGLRPQRGP